MSTLADRIAAILGAPRLGAVAAVRTSEAFAARFRADAERSGLTVDVQGHDGAAEIRVCPTCGAQNGRYVSECFNCQTELTKAHRPAPAAAAEPSARPPAASEARWVQVINAPAAPRAPLLKVPLVRRRFEAQLQPPRPADSRSIADRFLTVFVEREREGVKPVAARFDQRSVLDKFLSVFVEREGATLQREGPGEISRLGRLFSVFVEKDDER